MPLNISLYLDDWKQIALREKAKRNWCCECCGKQCYRPGEIPRNLTRSQWTANVLHLHHRDHNPGNNCDRDNYLAVCAPCHLQLHLTPDSPVSPGQLRLF